MNTLTGKVVELRPATMNDWRPIFEWLACSDITSAMMGPPLFPESVPYTWDEFCADYKTHFFDGTSPRMGRCFLIVVDGEAVGQVNYNDIPDSGGSVELDIWLRAKRYCGRGYGSDALEVLVEYLYRQFGVTEFFMQPSARNPRAIRAYEKAGFRRVAFSLEEAEARYGRKDYYDSVFLVKKRSDDPPEESTG